MRIAWVRMKEMCCTGDHYEIEGYDALPLNARVGVAWDSERFVNRFIRGIKSR